MLCLLAYICLECQRLRRKKAAGRRRCPPTRFKTLPTNFGARSAVACVSTRELKACEQMRDVIADKLALGEPKDAIKEYFIAHG